jgi:hypothetical protein
MENKVEAHLKGYREPTHYDIYVDGVRVGVIDPDAPIEFVTAVISAMGANGMTMEDMHGTLGDMNDAVAILNDDVWTDPAINPYTGLEPF